MLCFQSLVTVCGVERPGSTDEDVSAIDKVHEVVWGLQILQRLSHRRDLASCYLNSDYSIHSRWVVGKGGKASTEGRDGELDCMPSSRLLLTLGGVYI